MTNLKAGAIVVLKPLPPGLLEGLPVEDQRAIRAIVGRPVLLRGYDEDGRAELYFPDPFSHETEHYTHTHIIYVAPEFISLTRDNEPFDGVVLEAVIRGLDLMTSCAATAFLVGTRAIADGGPFDSAAATNLEAVVKTELGGRPKADTAAALAKVRGPGKWIDTSGFFPNLLRRNFDGDPWMVGLPVDAKATPAWLTPTRFTAQYSNFGYEMNSSVIGLGFRVNLSNIQVATDTIRALYVAAHPGWDQP